MNCTISSDEYPIVPVPENILALPVKTTDDIYPLVKPFAEKATECGILITLDKEDKIITMRITCIGGRGQGTMSICDMLRVAVQDHAEGIIVAHNHPNADLVPSETDWDFLRVLKHDSNAVGVRVVDCFTFSSNGFQSLLAPLEPMERIRGTKLHESLYSVCGYLIELGQALETAGTVCLAVVTGSIVITLSQGLPAGQLSSFFTLTLIYPAAFVCKSIGKVGQLFNRDEGED